MDETKACQWSERTNCGQLEVARMYIRKLTAKHYDAFDPTYQEAMKWLKKCQNIKKEDSDYQATVQREIRKLSGGVMRPLWVNDDTAAMFNQLFGNTNDPSKK